MITYGPYEVNLENKSPDVFITGGGISLLYHAGMRLRPNEPAKISAPFDSYSWFTPSGEQVSREKLMVVLTNLDGIYIKAGYGLSKSKSFIQFL